jgi:hypothetical protein
MRLLISLDHNRVHEFHPFARKFGLSDHSEQSGDDDTQGQNLWLIPQLWSEVTEREGKNIQKIYYYTQDITED